ncbi:MAG: dCTP deaminase [bacterium]
MILCDDTLKQLISDGDLLLDPYVPDHVQPASIDCCLGDHYLMMDEQAHDEITFSQPISYKEVISDAVLIQPKSFLLATTREYIKIPNGLSAFVEGRSSVGRMGLFIQNAGWVDTGFEGRITLELFNASDLPIRLESGRRICQLVFCKMDQAAQRPYQGKYLKQTQSVGSLLYKDLS